LKSTDAKPKKKEMGKRPPLNKTSVGKASGGFSDHKKVAINAELKGLEDLKASKKIDCEWVS